MLRLEICITAQIVLNMPAASAADDSCCLGLPGSSTYQRLAAFSCDISAQGLISACRQGLLSIVICIWLLNMLVLSHTVSLPQSRLLVSQHVLVSPMLPLVNSQADYSRCDISECTTDEPLVLDMKLLLISVLLLLVCGTWWWLSALNIALSVCAPLFSQ